MDLPQIGLFRPRGKILGINLKEPISLTRKGLRGQELNVTALS